VFVKNPVVRNCGGDIFSANFSPNSLGLHSVDCMWNMGLSVFVNNDPPGLYSVLNLMGDTNVHKVTLPYVFLAGS